MIWYKTIIDIHATVTNQVSHSERMKSNRYFVWQEDGQNDFKAGNLHAEKAVSGTTDLYTKLEFDPWKDEFEASLGRHPEVAWALNSIQYEEDEGWYHYEWVWEVPYGKLDDERSG